jgi:hypothetical protein
MSPVRRPAVYHEISAAAPRELAVPARVLAKAGL